MNIDEKRLYKHIFQLSEISWNIQREVDKLEKELKAWILTVGDVRLAFDMGDALWKLKKAHENTHDAIQSLKDLI